MASVESSLGSGERVARAAFRSVRGIPIFVLAVAIVLIRLPTLDFSALNYDEAVYALMGESLRTGLLPYVDLVDRKPIGLFAIFAFAETVLRDGIIGPRVLGALATVGSATLIAAVAQHVMRLSTGAAIAAGIFFGMFGMLFGGDAAQAPVFYSPLVIGGGMVVLAAVNRLAHGGDVAAADLGIAGLLLGLSLQVKYSTVFECVGFGLLLIGFAAARWPMLAPAVRRRLAAGLGLMALAGLAPTVIVGAVYAALGHFDEWYFYNFVVNVGREASDYARGAILQRAIQFTVCLLPLAVLAAAHLKDRWAGLSAPRRWAAETWVLIGVLVWFAAALLGGLALRQPYAHYFYGAIPPLSLLAGAGLMRPPARSVGPGSALIAVGLVGFACAAYALGWRHEVEKNGSPYLAYRIADLIRSEAPGSLYVFNHFGVLYHLTGLAVPTKYPMPSHLWRELEARSFKFDGHAELTRVLNGEPAVIVASRPFNRTVAADRVALLDERLAQAYCTWRTYGAGRHTVYVYRRAAAGEAGGLCN